LTTWSDQETRELVSLWPKASASQIAARLKRPRGSVTGKVQRLQQDGVLPRGVKHFEVVPPRVPRIHQPQASIMPEKPSPRRGQPPQIRNLPPPPPPLDDSLARRPCSLYELTEKRCHWPLGTIDEVSTHFCGGSVAPRQRYCPHHLRVASKS